MRPLTEQERHALAVELLASELAERVVQKLVERQKRALVVFTGSDMGIKPALECLKELRGEGFTYKVLMTRSAAAILGTQGIQEQLKPEELWVEVPGQSPEALSTRYDTVLVPTLTVNTAAHVANCMADTPAAALILDALMKGKNVVVSVDGACPDNPERARRGFRMTGPMKDALRGNLEKIQAFGGQMTNSEHLCKTALKAVHSFLPVQAASKPAAPVKAPASGGVSVSVPQEGQVIRPAMTGRILSVKAVNTAPRGAVIVVPKGTIVTALASDEARRLGITIRVEA